tara:strand:- start:535 stop:768 length:234 start_codon:yes stop_codon:yes gene_type:complete
MNTDKYIILNPSALKDNKIDTINFPKFETLHKKVKKKIKEKSRKNNTTLDYEYMKWWVYKGDNLVKKSNKKNPQVQN